MADEDEDIEQVWRYNGQTYATRSEAMTAKRRATAAGRLADQIYHETHLGRGDSETAAAWIVREWSYINEIMEGSNG